MAFVLPGWSGAAVRQLWWLTSGLSAHESGLCSNRKLLLRGSFRTPTSSKQDDDQTWGGSSREDHGGGPSLKAKLRKTNLRRREKTRRSSGLGQQTVEFDAH